MTPVWGAAPSRLGTALGPPVGALTEAASSETASMRVAVSSWRVWSGSCRVRPGRRNSTNWSSARLLASGSVI